MTSRLRTATLLLLTAFSLALAGRAQDHPNFSGTWKLDGTRSVPPRKTNVTLHIDHQDPQLNVEILIARETETPRHAQQHYTTNGEPSTSTGADGDEFLTAVVWQGQSLAFRIEEHEDGRILHSKETWTLMENGKELERVRDLPDGKQQTLIYLRQP